MSQPSNHALNSVQRLYNRVGIRKSPKKSFWKRRNYLPDGLDKIYDRGLGGQYKSLRGPSWTKDSIICSIFVAIVESIRWKEPPPIFYPSLRPTLTTAPLSCRLWSGSQWFQRGHCMRMTTESK